MQKSRITRSLLIILGICLICSMSVGLYSVSKNTVQMQWVTGTHGDNEADYRAASFDILVDGQQNTTVNFKAYATTKLSDIEKQGDTYLPNSFVPDAYQTHTITVTNNSEVAVDCSLLVTRTTNDDRVFYVVLPDQSDIVQGLYTTTDMSTPQKVRAYADSKTFKNGKLDIGETKTFTMVIWSEHDAVFPDTDGDGIADESTKKLTELSNGVPTEEFTLNYSFDQAD